MLPIAVPVPTFRRADDQIDRALTSRYAEQLCSTWAKFIIVAGPAGSGEACTATERAEQALVWLANADKSRLVLACWHPDDFRFADEHEIRPLAMLSAESEVDLRRATAALPPTAIAYANPRYSRALLTPAVLAELARTGDLPATVKLSKVTTTEIAELRSVAGPSLRIWHGSARNIAASLDAGASVVVAPPLAARPRHWPQPNLCVVQHAVNEIQRGLDDQPDHWSRVRAVTELAQNS